MAVKAIRKTTYPAHTRTAKARSRSARTGQTSWFSYFKFSESYTSLILGMIVVVFLSLFVMMILKRHQPVQDISATSTVNTETAQAMPAAPSTYTVQPGDDLWHIAEKVYQDGSKWTEIAKLNNLTDPNTLYSGNTLTLPKIATTATTISQTSTVTADPDGAITGTSYTVQKGDNLWQIAVRAYNDGYQWVKIAQANNLANPGEIYSGNVLQIPR